ncbi:MAG TPA: hypothetical protein VLD64_03970 [Nitrosarchaeum sp.]|nr:hypothetical protein [Nitrosarchaeum sp.]
MNNIPKKFPEYLIMYKTLTKKILSLNDEKEKAKKEEVEKIQDKIKKYEIERIKIKSMFPEKFFNTYLEDE